MAQEITVSCSLSFFKSSVMEAAVSRALASLLVDVAGNYYQGGTMLVATSATAIPLGSVTAPHYAVFLNQDATNFIKLRAGSSGADLVKLKAGEAGLIPLLDTAVPYAIADTAACLMEYLIISL
jgi:hypothetical protein